MLLQKLSFYIERKRAPPETDADGAYSEFRLEAGVARPPKVKSRRAPKYFVQAAGNARL